MTEELGRTLPSVVATVDVRDRKLRQVLVRNVIEAHDVDPIHLANRGCVSNPEGSHAAVLAEVVVVLHGVEQVLRQL